MTTFLPHPPTEPDRLPTGLARRVSAPVDTDRSTAAATRILEALRAEPALLRRDLGRRTQLSPATVTRTTAGLIRAGLVREQPDGAALGGKGRPANPLALVENRHVCIGVHLGRTTITVAAGDLRGRVLAQRRVRNVDYRGDFVAATAREAGRVLDAFLDRELVSAGLVAPWQALGLAQETVARRMEAAFDVPLATGDHVEAIVAAEVVRRPPPPGLTCYLYARNVSGFALVLSTGTRTEISRTADLTHLPTGSAVECSCGRTGCFEVSVGERAVLTRALRDGIITRPDPAELDRAARRGDREAFATVQRRAACIGRAAALVRGMHDPDRFVLLGQAIPTMPSAVAMLRRTLRLTSDPGPIDVVVSDATDSVQATAACAVALRPVYDDPAALTAGQAAAG